VGCFGRDRGVRGSSGSHPFGAVQFLRGALGWRCDSASLRKAGAITGDEGTVSTNRSDCRAGGGPGISTSRQTTTRCGGLGTRTGYQPRFHYQSRPHQVALQQAGTDPDPVAESRRILPEAPARSYARTAPRTTVRAHSGAAGSGSAATSPIRNLSAPAPLEVLRPVRPLQRAAHAGTLTRWTPENSAFSRFRSISRHRAMPPHPCMIHSSAGLGYET